ncbi:MAG: HD domain-containing protein [Candidatus Kerfeldbacteria bacterium]|nr:HD domain-containing protein [Candidatus Kerfeldbacteria bacterium]
MDWHEANEAIEAFPGRETALRKITRYSLYRVMFYRTNLFTHSKRVAWIANEIAPYAKRVFGTSFNPERAIITALVHDDHEIIMGDIQRGNKNKMNAQQKSELRKIEERAVETIIKKFPDRIGPYRYGDLLWSVHHLDCLEAQVVEFADKFDAFGEALHETFGGNTTFTENVTNEYGTIETPFYSYIPFLSDFPNNHPDIKPLFDQSLPMLQKPEFIDFRAVALSHTPHTKNSLAKPSGYRHYDEWKRIILQNADEEESRNLYVRKEFL